MICAFPHQSNHRINVSNALGEQRHGGAGTDTVKRVRIRDDSIDTIITFTYVRLLHRAFVSFLRLMR